MLQLGYGRGRRRFARAGPARAAYSAVKAAGTGSPFGSSRV